MREQLGRPRVVRAEPRSSVDCEARDDEPHEQRERRDQVFGLGRRIAHGEDSVRQALNRIRNRSKRAATEHQKNDWAETSAPKLTTEIKENGKRRLGNVSGFIGQLGEVRQAEATVWPMMWPQFP